VVSPQLWQNISIMDQHFCDLHDEDSEGWLAPRESFLWWLRHRAAPSVRHLQLELIRLNEVWVGDNFVMAGPGLHDELIEACAAARHLLSLDIRVYSPLRVSAHSLSGLISLTSLSLLAGAFSEPDDEDDTNAPTLVVSGLGAQRGSGFWAGRADRAARPEPGGHPLAITDAALPPGLTSLLLSSSPSEFADDLPSGAELEFIPPKVGACGFVLLALAISAYVGS
jgi:hypothetical protein